MRVKVCLSALKGANGTFRPVIVLTRYLEASLEDLVQSLGIIVVMSQQPGAVAHHGPMTAVLMLTHTGKKNRTNQFLCFFLSKL